MFALTLVIICVFGTATGQIAMKNGMSQIGEIGSIGQLLNYHTLFRIFTNPWVWLGIFCYGISLILWLGALSALDVSFMYPLMSLAYVITALVAFIFLKENVTLVRWLGIILIVSGCFLVSRTG